MFNYFDIILILIKALLVSKIGGEYLTEKLLQHIEHDLNRNITPFYEFEKTLQENNTYSVKRIKRENVT